jgi:hypothetical protein
LYVAIAARPSADPAVFVKDIDLDCFTARATRERLIRRKGRFIAPAFSLSSVAGKFYDILSAG